jgi:low temperature requirement protein LtrA
MNVRVRRVKRSTGKTINSLLVLALLTLNIRKCSHSWSDPFATEYECRDFCLLYGGGRFSLALAWARTALTSTVARSYCAGLSLAHVATGIFWFINASQQANTVSFQVLWWAPIAIDIGGTAFPMFLACVGRNDKEASLRRKSNFIPLDYHLYDERLGLIALLAMGESITAASGVGEKENMSEVYSYSVVIVATVFGLNMLYFRSGEQLVREGRHALRANVYRAISWLLLHVPLIFAMLLQGSISEIIIEIGEDTPFLRSVYCITVGGIFIISALLQSLHEGGGKVDKKISKRARMFARWACGAIIFAIGYVPITWITGPFPILCMVLVVTLAGVCFDTYGSMPKFHQEVETRKKGHKELQTDVSMN